jgi:hypothetical protein
LTLHRVFLAGEWRNPNIIVVKPLLSSLLPQLEAGIGEIGLVETGVGPRLLQLAC